MKQITFILLFVLLIATTCFAWGDGWNKGDLDMASDSIDGHPTAGLAFDPDNDGTNEIYMTADGDLTVSNLTTVSGSGYYVTVSDSGRIGLTAI